MKEKNVESTDRKNETSNQKDFAERRKLIHDIDEFTTDMDFYDYYDSKAEYHNAVDAALLGENDELLDAIREAIQDRMEDETIIEEGQKLLQRIADYENTKESDGYECSYVDKTTDGFQIE